MMSHICFPLEPEEHEQVRKKHRYVMRAETVTISELTCRY